MKNGRLDALQISTAAEQLLTEHPVGHVHSVYKNTVNLDFGERFLVSLTTAAVDTHPFSIRVDADTLDMITPSSSYRLCTDEICFDEIRISLSHAQSVDLRMPTRRRSTLCFPDMIDVLAAALHPLADRSPLSFLIFPDQNSPLRNWENALRAFAEAIISEDASKIEYYSPGLLGMGWGLTPSVDDLCVGLFAAKQLCDGPLSSHSSNPLSALVEIAFHHTNIISYNFLYHAHCARFSSKMLALCDVLAICDWASVAPLVRCLADYGHSSGVDSMTGLYMGIKMMMERK